MPKNDTIFKRLEQATEAEKLEICNILGLDTKYINDNEKISAEFRSVSGHSVANTFRDAHALEYKTLLEEIYLSIKIYFQKDDNFEYLKASEQELENKVNTLLKSMLSAHIEKNPKTANEELKNQLISYGNKISNLEGIIGGGELGLLARLISLPVSVAATAVQYASTPTYRKTFPVVVILIHIKNRLKAEQKLKDK